MSTYELPNVLPKKPDIRAGLAELKARLARGGTETADLAEPARRGLMETAARQFVWAVGGTAMVSVSMLGLKAGGEALFNRVFPYQPPEISQPHQSATSATESLSGLRVPEIAKRSRPIGRTAFLGHE